MSQERACTETQASIWTTVVEQLATQSTLNLFIEFICTVPNLYKQYLVLEAFSLAQWIPHINQVVNSIPCVSTWWKGRRERGALLYDCPPLRLRGVSCWKLCDYWRLPSLSPPTLTGPTRRIITNYPTTATLVPNQPYNLSRYSVYGFICILSRRRAGKEMLNAICAKLIHGYYPRRHSLRQLIGCIPYHWWIYGLTTLHPLLRLLSFYDIIKRMWLFICYGCNISSETYYRSGVCS